MKHSTHTKAWDFYGHHFKVCTQRKCFQCSSWREKDLSCAQLKSGSSFAKADLVDAHDGGTFDIQWIKLGGYVCDEDLHEKAEELRFASIFHKLLL